ncbi:ABC transporter permease [Pseudoflavonifractor sp. 524-17]|uniref:ABC transporter permease n=1 Tax=Pseudoflavonifractor sp. 524-17 TaxID=2304577 RepID=UPI00137A1781|nr:ABC transporter permease [Pseudoflavonifractor sp. 524-17]NCE65443.1 ABC transporter permease [Pseudoflavonifractor sp. 524-17]
MLKEYFQGIWRDRFILASLVNTDLQKKYRRSKLGVAWAILTPLGLSIIMGSVYGILFGVDVKEFIPFLFAGLNPWQFISGSADGGTGAFLGAEGYLKQTTVNAQIFPIRTVIVNFINLLYSILAFFTLYLFLDPLVFSAEMLLCVPGLIVLFLFALGLANFSSVINLDIRDFQPFQTLLLQGIFYATPIVYQASMLKEKGVELLYQANPFYYLLEIVRTPMQGSSVPPLEVWLSAAVISLITFFGSIYFLMKRRSKIVFKL